MEVVRRGRRASDLLGFKPTSSTELAVRDATGAQKRCSGVVLGYKLFNGRLVEAFEGVCSCENW